MSQQPRPDLMERFGDSEANLLLRGQRSIMEEGPDDREVRQLATIARLQARLIDVEQSALEEKLGLFERIRELEGGSISRTSSEGSGVGAGASGREVGGAGPRTFAGGERGEGRQSFLAGLDRMRDEYPGRQPPPKEQSEVAAAVGSVGKRMSGFVGSVFGGASSKSADGRTSGG